MPTTNHKILSGAWLNVSVARIMTDGTQYTVKNNGPSDIYVFEDVATPSDEASINKGRLVTRGEEFGYLKAVGIHLWARSIAGTEASIAINDTGA